MHCLNDETTTTTPQASEDALIAQKIRVEQEQWLLRRTQYLRRDELQRLEELKAEAEYLDGLVRRGVVSASSLSSKSPACAAPQRRAAAT